MQCTYIVNKESIVKNYTSGGNKLPIELKTSGF